MPPRRQSNARDATLSPSHSCPPWWPAAEPVVRADNLRLMRRLPDGVCDLIYADPPFDIPRTAAACARFLTFLRPRLEQMHRLLNERGTLYLHLDWRTAHRARCLMDDIFGEANFLNEIIWSYRTGARPRPWFARKHDTILAYTRRLGRHVFHPPRGGAYRTQDLRHDESGRPYKSTRNGRLYFHPDGPLITDVWDIPFLSTVSRERVGYPSQKPLALLERIIRASSDEGATVADFFCGSGTTLVAAARLGRVCVGSDINPQAVRIARRRLRESPDAYGPA